tara:strand:- start:15 stop:599 length:585 start_codon:yes stop_codon:yes gene_type:complete
VLDLKGRARIAPFLDPVAVGLAKLRITPTSITVLGLAITIYGSVLLATELYAWGAVVAGVGALLDALDGPLARLKGIASNRGAFIDTMSDRLGEVAIFTSLAFARRDEGLTLILCVLGLSFSLLTPYVRAKAESWGAEGRGGWMGRAERMLLVLVGAGLAQWFSSLIWTLWLLVILSSLTVAQRVRRTWQQLET